MLFSQIRCEKSQKSIPPPPVPEAGSQRLRRLQAGGPSEALRRPAQPLPAPCGTRNTGRPLVLAALLQVLSLPHVAFSHCQSVSKFPSSYKDTVLGFRAHIKSRMTSS
jgi:hypothetical protein